MSLAIGDTAPDFTLQDTAGEHKNLRDLTHERQVVLLFFPLAFSDACTTELCTIRDNMKLYNSLKAKVVGISVDSFYTLREFKKSHNLNFTLLSDFNKEVSRRYGVLNENFYGMHGVSKRASFVVSRDQAIKYIEILDDARTLPDFNAMHSALSK